MTRATIAKKIRNIEIELAAVKKSLKSKPDFSADRKSWKKIEPAVRKTRKKLYKETYEKR